MLRKINIKEFKRLYRKHIVRDFPRSERSTLNKLKKRILKGNEVAYIYQEDNKEKAYIIVAILNNYVLITFLAVFEDYRGEGIGTKLLKEIEQKFNNKRGILLEVENPQYSIEEKEIRQRRINFYQRANYKIVDGVGVILHGIMFYVMILSMNDDEIKKLEIAKEIENFYYNISRKLDKDICFNIIEK